MGINWKGAAAAAGESIAALGDTMVQQHFMELRDQRMADIANKKMDKEQKFQTDERKGREGYLSKEAVLTRDHQTKERKGQEGYLTKQATNKMAHTEKMEDLKDTNAIARNATSDANADARLDKDLEAREKARREGYVNEENRDNREFAHEFFFKNMDQKAAKEAAEIKARISGNGHPLSLKDDKMIMDAANAYATNAMTDFADIVEGTPEYRDKYNDLAAKSYKGGLENYAATGVMSMPFAGNQAVDAQRTEAIDKESFLNPKGDSGIDNAEIYTTLGWVGQNLKPNRTAEDVQLFLSNHGAGEEYIAKVIQYMSPPKLGEMRVSPDGTTRRFVGGQGAVEDNYRDPNQWALTMKENRQNTLAAQEEAANSANGGMSAWEAVQRVGQGIKGNNILGPSSGAR